MPTHKKALLTSVTADSKKGRRFVEICRAQYNKAELNDEEAQNLNEHPGWAAYAAAGIRQFSAKGPVFPVYLEIETGGRSKDKLLAALKVDGFEASTWAQDIMGKPAWKPGKKPDGQVCPRQGKRPRVYQPEEVTDHARNLGAYSRTRPQSV